MLSNDDREWLESKFTRVHERMDNIDSRLDKKGSDIHRIDLELTRPCGDVVAHEDRFHNPAKTWGIVGAMVGALTGIVELAKWLFKRGTV